MEECFACLYGIHIVHYIGEYNTCQHLCEYCYANANKATSQVNYRRARAAGMSGATITGG